MSEPKTPNAIILSINGLVLNPSTFDPQAKNGSLTIANNVVIDRPSVVATRRGFNNEFSRLTNDGALSIFQYSNTKLINTSDGDLHVDVNSDGVLHTYQGTYTPPGYTASTGIGNPENRIRGLETNKNFYFITDAGTYRLDHIGTWNSVSGSMTAQPRYAGAPPGLNGTATTVGTNGFFLPQSNIAYRIVFGYKDYNQQLILGAPSSRIIVSNTSPTALTNASVTFQLPKEVQAAPSEWLFQVYRGNATANLITEPDDEMALTYEDICSNYTISSGSITITDITPVTLLGAALYTNNSQNGILQSQYRPPWATDICTFKQYAFYANTRTLMNSNLTLISAGGIPFTATGTTSNTLTVASTVGVQIGSKVRQGSVSGIVQSFTSTVITCDPATVTGIFTSTGFVVTAITALQEDDTITFSTADIDPITGLPYTFTLIASTSNNAALGTFAISNTGNPAVDIQATGNNICLIANAYTSNHLLTVYYTSNSGDVPGQMNFARLTLIDSAFTITTTRNVCWEQAIPVVSTNDSRPNRIYYSVFNQPEAVPLVNYIEVGSANSPIRRIIPLRDGVMVLKDDGVFRIANNAPPFTITPIDYNVHILAANTAAELNNKVYFLSDQGVVALSDSDVQIMSIVLDKTIIENTSPDLFPNLKQTAWGLAYQADHKYILFMPSIGTDVQSTQQYVYNHIFQLWTRWTLGTSCGIIFRKDGKMYLGSVKDSASLSGDSYIYQERKSFTASDYADNQYTTTTSTSGLTNTIVVANPILPPGVLLVPGMTVQQLSVGSQANIVNVVAGPSFTTLTLDLAQNWAIGSLVIYTPVYSEVQTIQLDCDNPAMNKQFSEIVYIFTEQGFNSIDVAISSNTAGVPISDTLIPTQRGGWGIDLWGSTWGGGLSGQGKIRRYVPQAVQRAGWLYLNLQHAECFTSFGWSGIELWYKNTSTREK